MEVVLQARVIHYQTILNLEGRERGRETEFRKWISFSVKPTQFARHYGFYIRNFKMDAYIICVENGAAIFYDKPMPIGRFSP